MDLNKPCSGGIILQDLGVQHFGGENGHMLCFM